MSPEREPGKQRFCLTFRKTEQSEAEEFARARVLENWITHFYRFGDFWIVEWWCE